MSVRHASIARRDWACTENDVRFIVTISFSMVALPPEHAPTTTQSLALFDTRCDCLIRIRDTLFLGRDNLTCGSPPAPRTRLLPI
jgi:hypothetical protein